MKTNKLNKALGDDISDLLMQGLNVNIKVPTQTLISLAFTISVTCIFVYLVQAIIKKNI